MYDKGSADVICCRQTKGDGIFIIYANCMSLHVSQSVVTMSVSIDMKGVVQDDSYKLTDMETRQPSRHIAKPFGGRMELVFDDLIQVAQCGLAVL